MNIYSLLNFLRKKKNWKRMKRRNKGNSKTNFIFWNFEDKKKWKKGKKREIFRTNIVKEKNSSSI